jgi:hypothetical protein
MLVIKYAAIFLFIALLAGFILTLLIGLFRKT